jgi:hypothetical protein
MNPKRTHSGLFFMLTIAARIVLVMATFVKVILSVLGLGATWFISAEF